MKIVGVNGIATHGEGNIDILLRELDSLGFDTLDVKLPKRHVLSAWWGHKMDAVAIAEASNDGDVVVCHSFGGARTAQAMRIRNYKAVVFVNPAMTRFHRFNRDDIFCLHSKEDTTVKIGSWIPFHPFGRAGVDGFTDKSVNNIEITGGHNAAFEQHLQTTIDIVKRAAA